MIEKIARALQIKPYLLFSDEINPNGAAKYQKIAVTALSDSEKDRLTKRLVTAVRRIVRQSK
ncbi:MAG: hypothetical protein FWF29_03590 [Treponema sp.]|nr:hypothetical protein [Treponema sp.]